MLGLIPFVGAAGRKLGTVLKGRMAEKTLKKEVDDLGLDSTGVDIQVDDNGKVSVKGKAVSQEMKEKIILAVGNVAGVDGVTDQAEAAGDGPASQFHTVASGDTLSKVAKDYYGSWKLYPTIFEANKPMLTDPDKIYPGQVLRVPFIPGVSKSGGGNVA